VFFISNLFLKLIFSTVSGPLPRVGDRVVCQMKPAEGFGTQTPYKYYGFEVRSVQAPADTRRPRTEFFFVFF
jgi:hypothetical protein